MRDQETKATSDLGLIRAVGRNDVTITALNAVFLTGVSARALGLCGGAYLLQMFGITAGYHRYFSTVSG
jgi:hypothetical protein